ncbi:MAG: glycosyltransferase [Desulfovibrio sp.]|nr:glycosyltransferase [Desulfovibrio sp.]
MVRFEATTTEAGLDIAALTGTRRILMLGAGGAQRESHIVDAFVSNALEGLPVFLGAGMGYALEALCACYHGSFAVVEKETDLSNLTHSLDKIPADRRKDLLLLTATDPNDVLRDLTHWQQANGQKRLIPLIHPFYQRIDPAFYGTLRKTLEASAHFDFWSKVKHPRFRTKKPCVLLLTSKYFLMGELVEACQALDIDAHLVTIDNDTIGQEDFVKSILQAVLTIKPDCCITLNHMGIDREGVLMDLLARLELPLASWFVDNPHLIIHLYTKCISPWTCLFTFDEDNVKTLLDFGFPHVFYLPLGTNPKRFTPKNNKAPRDWHAKLSFVGNSMLYKVGGRLRSAHFPPSLTLPFQTVAKDFLESAEPSVRTYLAEHHPSLFATLNALNDSEAELAYETAITWQATRLYRQTCIKHLLPFHPTIAGDPGWKIDLAREPIQPLYLPEMNYYADLPRFYTCQDISFNCTSVQMKGAVNQRVFDCPASGGFVLTDWRKQMDALFTPNEMVSYRSPEEIPDCIRFYQSHESSRKAFARRARKRVLSCHTWQHRVQSLLATMRSIYGQ